jgi:hypothetical protein
MNTSFNNTRIDMVERAMIECLDEMYRSSQPSITWKEVINLYNKNPKRQVWQEHYLPQWLYTDILEKYLRMYRIGNDWMKDVELVENYLSEGGTKDKYIPETIDKDGFKHPGYRGYEEVPPISKQINEIITQHYGNTEPGQEHLVKKITTAVLETIGACKNYFNVNREEAGFRLEISNNSPNSNIEVVREFYKNNPHIKIHDIEKEKLY